MYNYHRQLFAKSNIEKQYFSHCVNKICNGISVRYGGTVDSLGDDDAV